MPGSLRAVLQNRPERMAPLTERRAFLKWEKTLPELFLVILGATECPLTPACRVLVTTARHMRLIVLAILRAAQLMKMVIELGRKLHEVCPHVRPQGSYSSGGYRENQRRIGQRLADPCNK